MKYRITTGLSVGEIRDAISENTEPIVRFRNYLKNKHKMFEGYVSGNNFTLKNIETYRSIASTTIKGKIIEKGNYNTVEFSAIYPWGNIIFYEVFFLLFLFMNYDKREGFSLVSLLIVVALGFVIFIFIRGKYIMDAETARDKIFKIIKGNSIENI